MLPDALRKLSGLITEIADQQLPSRFNCRSGRRKSDNSLVTEADLAVQEALGTALRAQWPEVAMLGEEMSEAAQTAALRRANEGVWCVDPLDGTSNFATGIPYYAVSVALLRHNRPEMAVVYDPDRHESFCAARGQGAWLNGERLRRPETPATLSGSIALIDFKRLPPRLAGRLASEPPYQSQRSFGAGALDWCWLAAGRVHLYLHGRQKLWDYAAGWLIHHETGGRSVTLQDEAVCVASLEPRSVAAAPDPKLFELWHDWLRLPLA
jgi:myo-inositol-1(or 4)-monophosphatase